MSHKGISFRLNSHITSIAILIIAMIVYINYHFSNKILVGKIEEGAINHSNLVISRISRITIGTEEIARNVSKQALYYYKNNDLDLFLRQVLASNNIIESIHVELLNGQQNRFFKFSSNKKGQLICNPDSIALERYLLKLNSGDKSLLSGIWSDPFYCKYDSTHLLVSYRIPISYPVSKEFAGIVSCEISLKLMQRMLSNVKIGENGYAFIIDKTGNFITHPRKEWILNKNLFEKPSAFFENEAEEIEAKMTSGGSGAGHGISQYLNKQKAWFYYSPLSNSNWTVIIVFPEKELYKDIEIGFR